MDLVFVDLYRDDCCSKPWIQLHTLVFLAANGSQFCVWVCVCARVCLVFKYVLCWANDFREIHRWHTISSFRSKLQNQILAQCWCCFIRCFLFIVVIPRFFPRKREKGERGKSAHLQIFITYYIIVLVDAKPTRIMYIESFKMRLYLKVSFVHSFVLFVWVSGFFVCHT